MERPLTPPPTPLADESPLDVLEPWSPAAGRGPSPWPGVRSAEGGGPFGASWRLIMPGGARSHGLVRQTQDRRETLLLHVQIRSGGPRRMWLPAAARLSLAPRASRLSPARPECLSPPEALQVGRSQTSDPWGFRGVTQGARRHNLGSSWSDAHPVSKRVAPSAAAHRKPTRRGAEKG